MRTRGTIRGVARAAVVAALAVQCAPPTVIRVDVRSELPCDAASAALFVAGGLADLSARAPSAVSGRCAIAADGSNALGDVALVPAGAADTRIAFAVAQRVDGVTAEQCLEPGADARRRCIVARRELAFSAHDELVVRVDLRRPCTGALCAADETCVRGACVSAELAPGACQPVCGEPSLTPAPPGGGFGPVVTVARPERLPRALFAAQKQLFWLTGDAGMEVIFSAARQPGTTPPGARWSPPDTLIRELTLVDGRLVALGWTTVDPSGWFVYEMPIDAARTGSIGTLGRVPVYGLAASPQHFWVLTEGASDVGWGRLVYRWARGALTPSPTVMRIAFADNAPPVAASSRALYWYSEGAIHELLVGAGAASPSTIATEPVTFLYADSLRLLFTSATGALFRVELSGTPPIPARLASVRDPGRITLDDAFVYWAERTASGAPGRIVALPLAGGAPVEVASADPLAETIASDEDGVYWAERTTGEIRMAPRRR